jgi:very-short-patch-repair endonuclease
LTEHADQHFDQDDDRRLALVTAAQRQWIDALTDLGGRNTLLYYKDRRAGTLDLGNADPDALERFEKTGRVRLTKLFTDPDERADAIRRIQAIYRKARELREERGIRAGYLATGLARWDELFLEPAAPVLLRGLNISPTRARYDEFDLTLDDDTEVNPVLLHKLATVFGATVDRPDPDRIAAQLAKSAEHAEIPGFRIDKRKVIGTFTYAKLPMVRDLEVAADLLADSDLVAAIAGDPQAQQVVAAPPEQLVPDFVDAARDDPKTDFSVLDADSSQRAAIEQVLAGRSLVIHGPPGTGKSQTIANLIAAMVARGRKVLFVAEKRAAIDAVLSRLTAVHLSDLVLDIHEGARDRQRIATELAAALDQAARAATPDNSALHRRLADRQRRLTKHTAALHKPHQPWGLTAYQVQSAVLGVPAPARVTTRLAAPERIIPESAEALRDELREFTRLGGFTLGPHSTPWFGAALRTRAQAQQAAELASTLANRTLPQLAAGLTAACRELSLPPERYHAYTERMRLTQVLTVLADSGKPSLGFLERRALRKQLRAEWQALPGVVEGSEPHLPSSWPAIALAWRECEAQLATLAAFAPLAGLDVDPESAAAALAADTETPWRLPRLYELAGRFAAAGLSALLDEVGTAAEVTPDLLADAFDWAWYRSVLDQIRVSDPDYAAEAGAALDDLADDFRRRDAEHLAANRARVRAAWARRLRETTDDHPLQARVIRKQAALRRGHLPLRRLLDQAGDVLFAAKPCWAMSPLMVSQVLPLARLFDLVIFDEASQVVPADAIGSMIRAHQVVVAGDDRQLPPTNFFRQADSGDAGDDDMDSDLVSFDVGFESVLDALRPLLATTPLSWHYRSRDERLVAFSNERIYGGALTTFPGVARDDVLRHVVADDADAEVDEVVRLILQHARSRPSESLGVIALGIKHADRVDTALRAALTAAAGSAGSRELEEFFMEDVQEPFFVKNLERVQGDERDAIIISVGYGKHSDGRMRYQWGPLLRDGGERRLNVAATRARRRLTVVSSFSSHDVDPARLTAPGARMLADYIEYARSGGMSSRGEGATCGGGTFDDKRTAVGQASQGDDGESGGLGAFEANVAARLADLGITVVPQYGVGGYRVDFAAAHPDDPSRMILAVEADGAAYRDSGSVRDRDRLRKEHLERLGWRVHRLWSTAWFTDPEAELAKLRTAYAEAVAANPPPPSSPPSPPFPAGSQLAQHAEPAHPAQQAQPTQQAQPAEPPQHAQRAEPGKPARDPGATLAIALGSGAPATGDLPQHGERGEIAAGQGTSGDREVHGYPPLLSPVDVLEVEQQRELIHDQRKPRAIGDGRDRVTPQPLVATDRDRADPGE